MGRFLKKWWKGSEGVTAVEFSLIGIPFILMTIGIIETAVMFTTNSLLQESTFAAARLIRTGQVQKSSTDPEQVFRDAVCDFSVLLIPCNDIQFQVKEVPSFQDAGEEPPIFDDDGNLQDPVFEPGTQNSIVLVRVVYNYPIYTPMFQALYANHGNKRTMMSTMVLQTEPYQ